MRRLIVCAVALLLLLASACGTEAHTSESVDTTVGTELWAVATTAAPPTTVVETTTTTAPPTTAPTTTAAPKPAPTAAPAPAPAADPRVQPVTAARLAQSWHAGCPVGPDQLRLVTVNYWGFDGATHTGELVVNAAVAYDVLAIFDRLAANRFPIRKIVTIEHYPGEGVDLDAASMADDNTSAFNCRQAVNPGAPPSWSEHAYGYAIDVNTVENPYVQSDGTVVPPAGAAYLDRGDVRPGMAVPGGELVAAFAAQGWSWGGRWASHPDYQHFSARGG